MVWLHPLSINAAGAAARGLTSLKTVGISPPFPACLTLPHTSACSRRTAQGPSSAQDSGSGSGQAGSPSLPGLWGIPPSPDTGPGKGKPPTHCHCPGLSLAMVLSGTGAALTPGTVATAGRERRGGGNMRLSREEGILTALET